jgi:hypothetical protein
MIVIKEEGKIGNADERSGYVKVNMQEITWRRIARNHQSTPPWLIGVFTTLCAMVRYQETNPSALVALTSHHMSLQLLAAMMANDASSLISMRIVGSHEKATMSCVR